MFLVPVSRETRQFSRLLDDTFDRVFGPVSAAQSATESAAETTASRSPALDVAETDVGYTVKLEVPGVVKDDIKVSVDGRKVSVQAQSQRGAEKKDGERVLYRERSTPRYARTFTLPLEVDQAESGAKLEHGVLTLTLPKRHLRAAAQITVN